MEFSPFWLGLILLLLIVTTLSVVLLKRKIKNKEPETPSPKLKKKSLVFSTQDPSVFINWAAPILEIFEDRRTRAQRRKARRERFGERRDEDK